MLNNTIEGSLQQSIMVILEYGTLKVTWEDPKDLLLAA